MTLSVPFPADFLHMTALALGCALGGIARVAITDVLAGWTPGRMPWGTFAVNVSGAFCAGWVAALILDGRIASWIAAAWLSGFLGSYTTVSTLSLNTLELVRSGRPRAALANLFGTLLAGLAAVAAGFAIGVAAHGG